MRSCVLQPAAVVAVPDDPPRRDLLRHPCTNDNQTRSPQLEKISILTRNFAAIRREPEKHALS